MSDISSDESSDCNYDLIDRIDDLEDRMDGLQDQTIGLFDRVQDRVQDLVERYNMSSAFSRTEPLPTEVRPSASQAVEVEDHHRSRHFPATARSSRSPRQEPSSLYLRPSVTLVRQTTDEPDFSDSGSLSTVDYDDIDSFGSSQLSLDMGTSASRTATHIPTEPIDLTGGSPPRPSPLRPAPNMSSNSTRPPKRRREEAGSDTTDSDLPSPRRPRRNATSTGPRSYHAAISVPAPSERSTSNPPLAPERQYAAPRPATTANRTIEQIDLCDDDDEDKANEKLQQTLQKQRADQVAAQAQPSAGTSSSNNSHNPTNGSGIRSGHTKLNSLTCTVCLETPTDLTATTCGHTFCRTCLLDWLVSSERDQSRRPNCPACRKALNWRPATSGKATNKDVVPVTFLKRRGVVG